MLLRFTILGEENIWKINIFSGYYLLESKFFYLIRIKIIVLMKSIGFKKKYPNSRITSDAIEEEKKRQRTFLYLLHLNLEVQRCQKNLRKDL